MILQQVMEEREAKTTLRLPQSMLDRAKICAIKNHISLNALIMEGLEIAIQKRCNESIT